MKRLMPLLLILLLACNSEDENKTLLATVQQGAKWGWIDQEGRWVIAPTLDFPSHFNEGLAVVAQAAPPDTTDLTAPPRFTYGYMDAEGKMVIASQFNRALHFSEGLAVTKNGMFVQFIDLDGKVKLNTKFQFAQPFINSFSVVAKVLEGKKGHINKEGKLVYGLKYDGVNDFNEGLAVVYNEYKDSTGAILRKYGAIDETGKEVIPLQYPNMGNEFRSGKCRFSNGKLFGYLDKTGRPIISPQYRGALNFRGDRAPVITIRAADGERKMGLIDEKGQLVVEGVFDMIDTRGYLSSGLILVGRVMGKDRRYGFIDKTGKLIVPMQYSLLDVFYEGLALARAENGKFGWIDTEGKWVIQPTYERGSQFLNPEKNYFADPDYFRD